MKKGHAKSNVRRWILLGAGAALVVAAYFFLPVGAWVESLHSWIESLGAWGPILFVLVYLVAGLLFFPASALTVLAGAIFGLWFGLLLVSLASTLVAAGAFWIARHLAREKLEKLAKEHPRFQAIDRAIGEGTWKVVLLARLSPVVPFNLLNYLFGVTQIRFWPYILASWAGMLPGTLVYVYLGDVGAAGATGREKSPLEWVLLGVGLVASIVVAVWIGRKAKAELEKPGSGSSKRAHAAH